MINHGDTYSNITIQEDGSYNLWDIIQCPEEFEFSKWYEHEDKYLKPALTKLGYTNISFYMGERDSFGPLTRIVHLTKDGCAIKAIYG